MLSDVCDLFTALATVALAWLAYRALQTWKHQIRTEKQLLFMEELIDTAHEYIQAMNTPIEMLHCIEIGIESHSCVANLESKNDKNAGIISYIQNYGKQDRAKLLEFLEPVRPIANKLSALAAKGQVMGFKDYEQCHKACTMLVWSFNQLNGFTVFLQGNYVWKNPTVQKALDLGLSIKTHLIKENLNTHDLLLLQFIKDNYGHLLN